MVDRLYSPGIRWSRCDDCGVEYRTNQIDDHGLCPTCQRIDDATYANDPAPSVETDTRPFTRFAMQERLGVCGDEDQ